MQKPKNKHQFGVPKYVSSQTQARDVTFFEFQKRDQSIS